MALRGRRQGIRAHRRLNRASRAFRAEFQGLQVRARFIGEALRGREDLIAQRFDLREIFDKGERLMRRCPRETWRPSTGV